MSKTAEEILLKNFKEEFGHEGHGEFMTYITKSMEDYASIKCKEREDEIMKALARADDWHKILKEE